MLYIPISRTCFLYSNIIELEVRIQLIQIIEFCCHLLSQVVSNLATSASFNSNHWNDFARHCYHKKLINGFPFAHLLTRIAFQTLPHIAHSRINLHGEKKKVVFNNVALNVHEINFQTTKKITLKKTCYQTNKPLKASFFSEWIKSHWSLKLVPKGHTKWIGTSHLRRAATPLPAATRLSWNSEHSHLDPSAPSEPMLENCPTTGQDSCAGIDEAWSFKSYWGKLKH